MEDGGLEIVTLYIDPDTGEQKIVTETHGGTTQSSPLIEPNELVESEPTKLDYSGIKRDAKASTSKRYKIGDTLLLKTGIRDGSEKVLKKFVVKKVIWKVKDNIRNILVLKQIAGPQTTIFTLSRVDCRRYHIKYEPGLQVYSMEMNFIKSR